METSGNLPMGVSGPGPAQRHSQPQMVTLVGKISVGLAGAWFLMFGGWSFFAPASFFETIATWKPYNAHLFHDGGAFSIGIGAGLFALWTAWRRLAVLVGAAVGATLHAVAHVIDRAEGGRSSDPLLLGGFALLLVVALFVEARSGQR